MTYIAAFGGKDGIVMCADTQESVEGMKNYVEKLSIVEDSSYPLAVGGAGFGSLIDCLIDEIIERATKERPSTKKDLKNLIQQGLTEVYESDLPALTLRRLDHAPQLLVAASTADGMCIYPCVSCVRMVRPNDISAGPRSLRSFRTSMRVPLIEWKAADPNLTDIPTWTILSPAKWEVACSSHSTT